MAAELDREWSREEIVELLEEQVRTRRGMTAAEFIQAYRDGTLEEPGELADLLALAYLLPEEDPLFAPA